MAHVRALKPKPTAEMDGKTRGEWVRGAVKAMIASTDAALIWKIVRVGGFLEFDRVARPMFRKIAGLEFTVDEIRVIFSALDEYVTNLEKTDRAHMTVNRAARKFEQDERQEYLDDKILTESITTAARAYTSGGQRIH